MHKSKSHYLFLLLLLPFSLWAKLNDNGDFQVWNTDTLQFPIGKKTHFLGQTEFHYGRGGSKLYYKHYQAGFRYFCSPIMSMDLAYRQISTLFNKKWANTYSPLFNILIQGQTPRGWTIGNRNQVQYLIYQKRWHRHNRWLYRNRTEIVLPVRIGRSKTAPFIADEFFWEETRGISQNRLGIGLKLPYHQRTVLDLSYMLQSVKNAEKKWDQHHVIWAYFSIRL